MNWLFDNFEVVAIVGLAFASWLKQRYDTMMAEREERESRNFPRNSEEEIHPEQEWQFPQEAPQPYVPPPIPPPIPQFPPPLPQFPPPLPSEQSLRHTREIEAEAVLKRQQEMQDRLRRIKEARTQTQGGAAATRARLASAQTGTRPVTSSTPSIRSSLKQPAELRRAIVMKEILGPPVSLR